MDTPVINTIVFDLDGTLVDSFPSILEYINIKIQEKSGAPVEGASVMPSLSAGIEKLFYQAIDLQTWNLSDPEKSSMATQFYAEYKLSNLESILAYSSIGDVLDYLKTQQYTLGICTNRDAVSTQTILHRLGLHSYFRSIVTLDDVAEPKPSPIPLQQSMRNLSSTAQNTLMVGDSMVDAQCAANSGVRFAAHLCGYGQASELQTAVFQYRDYSTFIQQLQAMEGN